MAESQPLNAAPRPANGSTASRAPISASVAQTPVSLQQGGPQSVPPADNTGLLTTTGRVNVNGVFTSVSSMVYDSDQVITPGQNGALLTAKGNVIALGPNAKFTARPNQYMLDDGASNVNTSTGWEARIKDWRVKPVNPNAATRYEVNYENDGVYVYARMNDVELISDPCHRRIHLEQGKSVHIPDPHRCGVMMFENPNWPRYVMTGGAAAGIGTAVYLYARPSLSAAGPGQ